MVRRHFKFDSWQEHHLDQTHGSFGQFGKFGTLGGVAQLVRAPACHAGGRRFEPGHSRQVK
jgi:hypothetical protein